MRKDTKTRSRVQETRNKGRFLFPGPWTLFPDSCTLSLKSQILPVFMPIMTDICPHFDIKQHNFSK
jgi:hypothetical protein